MTSQEADFDADLDFDRFGMTGFFEAGVSTIILNMSSSFNGFSEIGLALAMFSCCRVVHNTTILTEVFSDDHTRALATFSHS